MGPGGLLLALTFSELIEKSRAKRKGKPLIEFEDKKPTIKEILIGCLIGAVIGLLLAVLVLCVCSYGNPIEWHTSH